jgi:uncharacterized protein YjbI with pentapeptide repeats
MAITQHTQHTIYCSKCSRTHLPREACPTREFVFPMANGKVIQIQARNPREAVERVGSHNWDAPDLSESIFEGADFAGLCLKGAFFVGTELACASFWCCDLRAANFREADLRGANFQGADLFGACLHGALLEGANFCGAKLGRVDVIPGEIIKAELSSVDRKRFAEAAADDVRCRELGEENRRRSLSERFSGWI